MPEKDDLITEMDFDFIADKIREEQCVLVLGPEVYRTQNGQNCEDALLDYLEIGKNKLIAKFYPNDNFFLFDEPYKRTQIIHKIKKFYRGQEPGELLMQLARLPFHVYITVTSDLLLWEAFNKQGFNGQVKTYRKHREPQIIKKPSSTNPLVYNAFGSVESEESMVLTHDDLYDFFKSIFAQQSIPDKLKIPLKEVKNFIFLGISFDKWYMQLLLRELGIHNRGYEFTRYAANQKITSELRNFCTDQFQIQFVSHDIEAFIERLSKEFSEDELRQPQSGNRTGLGKMKELVASGKINLCLEEIEGILIDTPLEEVYDAIHSRFSRLSRRNLKGIISSEEYQLRENIIVDDLLGLIREGEKMGL